MRPALLREYLVVSDALAFCSQGALHSIRWSTLKLSPRVRPMSRTVPARLGSFQVGAAVAVGAVENLVDHGDHSFPLLRPLRGRSGRRRCGRWRACEAPLDQREAALGGRGRARPRGRYGRPAAHRLHFGAVFDERTGAEAISHALSFPFVGRRRGGLGGEGSPSPAAESLCRIRRLVSPIKHSTESHKLAL